MIEGSEQALDCILIGFLCSEILLGIREDEMTRENSRASRCESGLIDSVIDIIVDPFIGLIY